METTGWCGNAIREKSTDLVISTTEEEEKGWEDCWGNDVSACRDEDEATTTEPSAPTYHSPPPTTLSWAGFL